MTKHHLNLQSELSLSGSLTTYVTTVEELLSLEPFSDEIRQWLRDHEEVKVALKVIVTKRFISAHGISVVDKPDLKGVKQSIGIYSVDKKQQCMLKQDYLMHESNGTFVLFTGIPVKGPIKPSKYVQPISALVTRYGPGGKNFYDNHHPNPKQVPPKLRPYIEKAISTCWVELGIK